MQNRHQAAADANFYFFKGYPSSTKRIGGAERDRTADPLLAKQVLSQLSYSPIFQERRQPAGDQYGGAERDRTADLRSAIAALSQLSYGPSSSLREPSMPIANRKRQINPSITFATANGGPGKT
jgi:hypothetical protein